MAHTEAVIAVFCRIGDLEQIEQADTDVRAGRIARMTERELERLIADRTNGE
jgi:hypothetical protein